jgi:hypothetical protein
MSISSGVRELPGLVAEMLPHASDIESLSDGELTEFVRLLGQAAAVMQGAAAIAAAEIETRSRRELGSESLARKAGVRSGAELVQRLTGSSLTDARKAVRVGVMLETAHAVAPVEETDAPAGPRSIEALAVLGGSWSAPLAVAVRNGWLPAEHADRITNGLGQPRDDASTPAYRAAALRLIADCWEGDLPPEDAARTAKAMRAVLDREWATQNATRLYEQRSLKRTVRGDGMVKYDLLVDPATDAQIWTPIHRHLAPRLGGPRFLTDEEHARAQELEQDARTNEQLLCDTFTGFLTAGITSSDVFGKYTPTVTIAVTTPELKKAITADAARRNSPPGSPPGHRPAHRHPICHPTASPGSTGNPNPSPGRNSSPRSATEAPPGSSSTTPVKPSTPPKQKEPSPSHRDAPWPYATAAASYPAAPCHPPPAKHTTSTPGPKTRTTGRPKPATASSCAGSTTSTSTTWADTSKDAETPTGSTGQASSPPDSCPNTASSPNSAHKEGSSEHP